MATFVYRAVDRRGQSNSGEVQARDRADAMSRVRGLGFTPLQVAEAAAASAPRLGGRARGDAAKALDELGVLIRAGLPLDRALSLGLENIERAAVAAEFRRLLAQVREGSTLAAAMADRPDLFSASARALIEAGEASGRLGEALDRVAKMYAQEQEMRRIVSSAMIYPAALLFLAVGVILMMLLFVVPQFEGLFDSAGDKLPASSRALVAASRALRDDWAILLGILVAVVFGVRQLLRQPAMRAARDRAVLRLPQIGLLIRYLETARLARTLGGLVEGGVPVPAALAMATRAIGNRTIAEAIGGVATQVKEGGSLTSRIAATGMLPRIAMGFFRTGEETSQLGTMLERLADMLERDVKLRIERVVAIATPLITISLGGAVATIIASIMTAIIGFNDLAVNP